MGYMSSDFLTPRHALPSEVARPQLPVSEQNEMVPVHWMGAHRVESTVMRREDVQQKGSGTFRSPRSKTTLQQRQEERRRWKKLAEAGQKLIKKYDADGMLIHEEEEVEEFDPLRNTIARIEAMDHLKPVILQSTPSFRESRRGSVASLGARSGGAMSNQYSFYRMPREHVPERESSAANLITAMYRGEAARTGKRALCPFSGKMVPTYELKKHVDEWRALMRTELMSLHHDPLLGPRIGLFVIHEIPKDLKVPDEDSSYEEIQEWNDAMRSINKAAYVKCYVDGKKYHWTDLRKAAQQPTYYPWSDSAPGTPRTPRTPRGGSRPTTPRGGITPRTGRTLQAAESFRITTFRDGQPVANAE
eukprot:Sspe_Gene.37451::Locus_18077_Transcript_1_1_Confidence_1.000_Length_1439::g.37451::m.37451